MCNSKIYLIPYYLKKKFVNRNEIVIDGAKEYEIKTFIDGANLVISSKLKGDDTVKKSSILLNFEDLSEVELKHQIVAVINELGINYEPNHSFEDPLERIKFALNNDLFSAYAFHGIHELGSEYRTSERTLDLFSLIFRDILNEKAKKDSENAIKLLRIICYEKKFRILFFKRIAFYVICENWIETKSLFWELVKDKDAHLFFSQHKYEKELYELLKKNQQFFNNEEKTMLQKIIDKGPQEEINNSDEKYLEYWKLRWYSALKDTSPFKENYFTLSESLNINNEHFENLGKIRTRVGSVSPFTIEEALQRNNQELIDYIHTFKPKFGWGEPTIEGLADTLQRAVEIQPQLIFR